MHDNIPSPMTADGGVQDSHGGAPTRAMPAGAPKHYSLIQKVLHIEGAKGNRREMLIPSLAWWVKLATTSCGPEAEAQLR